jgi:ribose transport system permease protein
MSEQGQSSPVDGDSAKRSRTRAGLSRRSVGRQSLIQVGGLAGVLVIMVLVFGGLSKNFLQWSTFVVIANQTPDLTFLAVGMTLVLITGGIDLSVGSLLALSSAVLGVGLATWQLPLPVAVLMAVGTAACCGLFSGLVSIGMGIPSFIVTLGMLEIARGATKLVTDSQSIYIGRSVEWFGQPQLGLPVSPAFILACLVVLGGQLLLSRTVFGRYCVAIGTNREVVRMSGIRTAPYSIAVFAISGILCGLAGWSQAARLSAADPNAAVGIELSAIAACVIGGTSLSGGRGSVIRSFLGVLIIQVLQTGLAQLGVTDANKQIITGSVIIIAVLLDAARSRWLEGTS